MTGFAGGECHMNDYAFYLHSPIMFVEANLSLSSPKTNLKILLPSAGGKPKIRVS